MPLVRDTTSDKPSAQFRGSRKTRRMHLPTSPASSTARAIKPVLLNAMWLSFYQYFPSTDFPIGDLNLGHAPLR